MSPREASGSSAIPDSAAIPDDAALMALAARLGAVLAARGWRLATAESCTGGWIAKALTDVSGSSGWFESGLVTYSNRAKTALAGVPEALLVEHGAVSEPVVRAMAEGARAAAGCDMALAVSGIAGPDGGSETKPVGLVWLAWALPESTVSEHRIFAGDREAVRRATVARALARALELVAAG